MSNERISKSGVKRHGKRAGNVERLNQSTQAYSQATKESGSRYDGSHGFRLADGSWGTWVTSERLKDTGPLSRKDGENNQYVKDTNNPLPGFVKPTED